MIYILVGLVCATVLVVFLIRYADKRLLHEWMGLILGISMLLAILLVIANIVFAAAAASWFGAKYKADIVNREYGTKYTTAEIFWASSVIDTIRELDRERYEVNGDFRRQQADTKADRDARSYGNDQRK